MKNRILIFAALFFLLGAGTAFPGTENTQGKPVRIWMGYFSSNWFSAGNWAPVGVPNASDSVIVPGNSFFSPAVQGDTGTSIAICKGIVVESNGSKSPASGGMTISGGEIVIDGSLTIKSGATLTIESDGALTVNGDIKIMANGNLVVESGGSLITNGSITGSAKVKRIIPPTLSWHFLSSPVSTYPILDGVFAPLPANFSTTPSTSYDFYKFNSQCAPDWWINLRNIDGTANTTDFGNPPTFLVKSGYLVAYSSSFATTKVFTGVPNTGDMTFDLTATGSCSWNLLGNPYPSALGWSDVTGKGNLSTGYYYVWNENKAGGPGYEAYLNETYKTPGTDGNIPSMQGFFVEASPTGSKTIGIPNSSRVHDADLWLKKNSSTPANRLTLTFSNGTNFDKTFIHFGPEGTLGKDWYDAEKIMGLNNSIPQVYSIVDNDQKTLVNAMPYIASPVSVPIGIVAPADGNYSISVSDIDSFNSLSGLTLEDLVMNTSQNLVENPVYTFYASGQEDAGRFVLHFTSPIGIDNHKESNSVRIFASHHTVFISGSADLRNAHVNVFNLLGQEISSVNLSNASLNKLNLDLPNGYYIVKVQTQKEITTVKVNITD